MLNWLCCSCGSTLRDSAHLILRVVTGLIFLVHGYDKIFERGVPEVVQYFNNSGIPFPEVLAYLVAYGELIGGTLLILGLLTHWVSKVNILIVLGAIYFVHWSNGFSASAGGYEFALLLLAASTYFLIVGGGTYSLDAHWLKKCSSETA